MRTLSPLSGKDKWFLSPKSMSASLASKGNERE